jgi:arginine decarboxylase
MDALDTKEVHGYDPNRGYRVFLRSALLDGSAPVDGDGGGDGQGGGG